jgi:hypothetical protein
MFISPGWFGQSILQLDSRSMKTVLFDRPLANGCCFPMRMISNLLEVFLVFLLANTTNIAVVFREELALVFGGN